MSIRTFKDDHCDPKARYTAEFESRDLKVTDRAVVTIDISCFAPTRAKAVSDLKKTLRATIEMIQKELK